MVCKQLATYLLNFMTVNEPIPSNIKSGECIVRPITDDSYIINASDKGLKTYLKIFNTQTFHVLHI